jgi:hypothetical protein
MGPSYMDYHNAVVTQHVNLDLVGDEVWTINAASFDHRTDRIFWMDDLKKEHGLRPDTIERLHWLGVPVVSTTAYPEIVQKSEAYPIDAAAQVSMDIFGKVYLNNTIAYALVYAMMLGVEKLSVYGADYTYPNRNFAESGRACVEAWLTACKAVDIEVALPKNTSLFDNAGRVGNSGENQGHELYGYDVQPFINLGDGRVLSFQKHEHEVLYEQMQALMSDGFVKNAEAIEALDKKMKASLRAHQINELEQKLHELKKVDVEDAVSGNEPTPEGSGSEPVRDDSPEEHEADATGVPGEGVRDRGRGRQPSKRRHHANNGKRRTKGRVQGNSGKAVAPSESSIPGQPGEVATGSEEQPAA